MSQRSVDLATITVIHDANKAQFPTSIWTEDRIKRLGIERRMLLKRDEGVVSRSLDSPARKGAREKRRKEGMKEGSGLAALAVHLSHVSSLMPASDPLQHEMFLGGLYPQSGPEGEIEKDIHALTT